MDIGKFQRILLAVDGSDHARRAAGYAGMLAKLCDADVVLVHAARRVPEFIGEPYFQRMLDRIREQAEERISPCRTILEEGGVRFEERVLEDDPAEAIRTAAEVEGCDLVVMGARGLSDLQGVLLGSVSHGSCTRPPARCSRSDETRRGSGAAAEEGASPDEEGAAEEQGELGDHGRGPSGSCSPGNGSAGGGEPLRCSGP